MGLFYLRLIGSAQEIYTVCEKFISDPRPMNLREISGEYRLKHMDEFVDDLVREQIMFDIVLPRLPKREVLQDQGLLEEKISPLETELQRLMEQEIEEGRNPGMTLETVDNGVKSDAKETDPEDEAPKKAKKTRERSRSKSKEHKDKKKKHKRDSSSSSSDSEKERKKKSKKKLKKLLKEERKRQEREKERTAGPKETEEEHWLRLRREQGLAPPGAK